MNTTLDRSILRARYFFAGTLVMDTALHIGGGRESSTVTDGPIVRDSIGRPLIPGSSFKGAFRAGVERLLPNLPGFRTCQLADGYTECLSTNDDLSKDYVRISEAAGRGIALGVGDSQIARDEKELLRRLNRELWIGQELSEQHLLDLLAEYLCDTCKTFGSLHLASVARFHDLPVKEPWAETTQIRDGVGIDRDSERAIDQIKFDFEVVPAQTAFEFRLTVENPTSHDLGLIAMGLQEFTQGMIPLGGIRSRGLGRCHLQDVSVATLNFTDPAALRRYLTEPDWLTKAAQPIGDFVAQQITPLLAA
jgi:CRISPR-associated protein Csm3